MTLPLWGSLEKAQDDAQTIEQAIDAAIIEHENDPTAHLGAGESLEMHKSEPVIDHPAQSIVADKPAPFLSGALLFQEDGRGLSGWWINQVSSFSEVGGGIYSMSAHVEQPSPARADVSLVFAGYKITYATEILYLEFKADFSISDGVDSWVSVGWGSLYATGNGFGFRYKNSDGHLYAFHRIGATFYDTDLGVPEAETFHKYRVNFSDGVFTFYDDDVLVATHDTNIPTGSESSLITWGVVANASGDGSLSLRYIEYYQSSGMTDV